jgi:hypothetical protein
LCLYVAVSPFWLVFWSGLFCFGFLIFWSRPSVPALSLSPSFSSPNLSPSIVLSFSLSVGPFLLSSDCPFLPSRPSFRPSFLASFLHSFPPSFFSSVRPSVLPSLILVFLMPFVFLSFLPPLLPSTLLSFSPSLLLRDSAEKRTAGRGMEGRKEGRREGRRDREGRIG